jgi:hypothetical protein
MVATRSSSSGCIRLYAVAGRPSRARSDFRDSATIQAGSRSTLTRSIGRIGPRASKRCGSGKEGRRRLGLRLTSRWSGPASKVGADAKVAGPAAQRQAIRETYVKWRRPITGGALSSAYAANSTASTNTADAASGVMGSYRMSTLWKATRPAFAEQHGSVQAKRSKHGGSRSCSVSGQRIAMVSTGPRCFLLRPLLVGSSWIRRTGTSISTRRQQSRSNREHR